MGTSQLHIENSNLGSHTLLVYESQLRPFLLKIEHQKGEAKVFALEIKSHHFAAGSIHSHGLPPALQAPNEPPNSSSKMQGMCLISFPQFVQRNKKEQIKIPFTYPMTDPMVSAPLFDFPRNL